MTNKRVSFTEQMNRKAEKYIQNILDKQKGSMHTCRLMFKNGEFINITENQENKTEKYKVWNKISQEPIFSADSLSELAEFALELAYQNIKKQDEKLERPAQEITFTVAECSEFHNLGEYHEGIESVDEAVALFNQIPPERMNGLPGIGINIHKKGTKPYEDIQVDIVMGKRIDLEILEFIPIITSNEEAMKAIVEMVERFPNYEVRGSLEQLQKQSEPEKARLEVAIESTKDHDDYFFRPNMRNREGRGREDYYRIVYINEYGYLQPLNDRVFNSEKELMDWVETTKMEPIHITSYDGLVNKAADMLSKTNEIRDSYNKELNELKETMKDQNWEYRQAYGQKTFWYKVDPSTGLVEEKEFADFQSAHGFVENIIIGKATTIDEVTYVLVDLKERVTVEAAEKNNVWGAWFAHVANTGRPQDYINVDLIGYSTTQEVVVTVETIQNNELTSSNSYTIDAKDTLETGDRTPFAWNEEFEAVIRKEIEAMNTDFTAPFEVYSPFGDIRTPLGIVHTLEEHYELLQKAGFETTPSYDSFNAKREAERELRGEKEQFTVGLTSDAFDIPYAVWDNEKGTYYIEPDGTVPTFETQEEVLAFTEKLNAQMELCEKIYNWCERADGVTVESKEAVWNALKTGYGDIYQDVINAFIEDYRLKLSEETINESLALAENIDTVINNDLKHISGEKTESNISVARRKHGR